MNAPPDHAANTNSYYRAYVIGWNGKFQRAIDLDGPDDETATTQAQQLVDDHAVEVWDRSRMLLRIEAKKGQAGR